MARQEETMRAPSYCNWCNLDFKVAQRKVEVDGKVFHDDEANNCATLYRRSKGLAFSVAREGGNISLSSAPGGDTRI